MLLLTLNTIICSAAATVWFLWMLKWFHRGVPMLASLYALASIGSLVSAFGFALVMYHGDPSASAVLARWWIWATVGLPSMARFIELMREDRRSGIADRIMDIAEGRARKYGRRHTDGGD
jgi:hypothetical protein